jgi:hypothetical protein
MKPISKGTFNGGYGFLASAFIFGLVALSYYLFDSALSVKFLQIDRLIAAIIFSLFFLYIIFKAGQEFKAVDIYGDSLKIKWAWGLLYYKLSSKDIDLFAESTKNKTEYLLIRSKKLDFLFHTKLTNNDFELIEQLRQWKVRRKDNIYFDEISSIEKKVGGALLILFGTLLFVFTINSYLKTYSLKAENELTSIHGTLQSEPDVKKQSLRSSSQYVSFYLKEHPQYRFEIDGAGYEAVDISKLDNYQQGTNTIFKILKRDYDVKIKNSVDPTYSEKHFNWTTINLYDAQLNSKSIMTLDEYNSQTRVLYDSNRKWGFLVFGIAIFLVLYGLKAYR